MNSNGKNGGFFRGLDRPRARLDAKKGVKRPVQCERIANKTPVQQ